MYIVTDEDVQIRFTGDGSELWASVPLVGVTYVVAPVGEHKPTARIGQQTWEGLLQLADPGMGKAVMSISVASIPDPSKRTMEFRFRVRDDRGAFISEWSESSSVRIIGKPGKPSYV